MSLLWEQRHRLDGLRPLVEIAHWAVIPQVPPEDQDDIEQEIVLELMQTVEKYGNKVGIDVYNLDSKGKSYLWKAAINRRNDYFVRNYKKSRLYFIEESDSGEMAGGAWLVSRDGDSDARLDAMATLATLPERLRQIGNKILEGDKLSIADQAYRIKQLRKLRPKLNCRKYANRISEGERKRILQLHSEDMCVHKIAITMGRTDQTILRVLDAHQLPSRRNWLAKERDERIRHAYFVDGKKIRYIARDFHCNHNTVRRAIRAAGTV